MNWDEADEAIRKGGPCKTCGRPAEGDHQGHWIGCKEIAEPDSRTDTRESECTKDGCTNPRAVSRGPRPAKYCDEHKTGSKK